MKKILIIWSLFCVCNCYAQKPVLTKGDFKEDTSSKSVSNSNQVARLNSIELKYFDFEIISKDKVRLTKSHNDWQEIEIPASVLIDGQKFYVTEIGARVFQQNQTLKKITLPNTIEKIGDAAFYGTGIANLYFKGTIADWANIHFSDWHSNPVCSYTEFYLNNTRFEGNKLILPNSTKRIGSYAFRDFDQITSIEIPNSVTRIEKSAFIDCDNLTSVIIPKSVNNIENKAFGRCNSLVNITVEDGNPKYDSRENCNAIIETKANTLIVACNNTTIPNTVKKIGDYSFYDCYFLKSLILPNSIEGIGANAFESCKSLMSIKLNEGLKYIHSKAFVYCYSLESIEMPNTVTSVGGGVFSACTKLKTVKLSNRLTSLPSAPSEYSNTIPTGMFAHCESLTEVIIPNSVTYIGDYAFLDCTSLTSLSIPSSITTVGSDAFNGIPSLKYVTIHNAPKDMVFFQCPSLTHITWNVKSGVDSQKPFDRIKNQILSFTFGEEVEYVPANICNGMANLESIEIPENIKQVGALAFANCNKLTLVTWNATNSKIGNTIFQNSASKIKCFKFGESVRVIPDLLCDGMSSLTSITIPKNIKIIGKNVFRYCRNLTSVIWNAENCEPTMWGEYQSDWYKNKELENDYIIFGSGKQDWYMYGPFSNISHKITSFKIGENVQQIPSYLCFGMSKAKITFHKDIQTIGEYALSEVYKVQFQGKVTQCANVFYNNKKWYDTIIYIPQEYLKYYKSLRTAMGLKKAKVIYKTF